MPVKYISYFPETVEGQAILDNFTRTRRVLRYKGNDKAVERIQRGLPLYETETLEQIGGATDSGNLLIRGECLSACAYLKDKGISVDLVYIDPPFASGADYARKIYLRKNPKIAERLAEKEAEIAARLGDGEEISIDEYKAFEEKMYGDIWDKESYLNWMYENLTAIRSIMSETGSIYVHLDWHIGHYVKILLDEVFGESNFQNDIVWHYSGWNKRLKASFEKRHDSIFIYTKSNDESTFNSYFQMWESKAEYVKKRKQKVFTEETTNKEYVLSDAGNGQRVKRYIEDALREGYVLDDVWDLDKVNNSAKESVDYNTQKPEELLARIIEASSDKGMIVADFFGGSGTTAAAAHRLGRRFITSDVGLNSLLTTRDRLKDAGATFELLDIKDGVSLFRNPVQTMDKLKQFIIGLQNEDGLDKFWEGAITDSKEGSMPVYIPDLKDHTTKVLDVATMIEIVHKAIPDLREGTKKVIVYYIDIYDRKEIEKYIKDQDHLTVEIELRDLKEILDQVVFNDVIEYKLSAVENGFEIEFDSFVSDRLNHKIDEYNEKRARQKSAADVELFEAETGDGETADEPKKQTRFKPIEISENGLELIELVSLDCTNKEGVWKSDVELKIDKNSFVILNNQKTRTFWDGKIFSEKQPLRMKVRNIAGDESLIEIKQ